MKFNELTNGDIKIFKDIWNSDMSRKKQIKKINLEFGIARRTIYDWADRLENSPLGNIVIEETVTEDRDIDKYDIVSEDKRKIHKLLEENKLLKKSLNSAKEYVHYTEEIRNLISEISNIEFTKKEVPKWVNDKTSNKIVPVFNIADVHIGEVVNPEDINFVNEYNTNLAIERINKCTDDFIDIYINKFNNYKYDGMVLNVMGDIITGELHDLAETNDNTSIDQVIIAVELIESQIRKLQKYFGKVLVNMVSGNHGRSQPLKYTKNSNRYHNSLEKIVYTFVEKNMKDLSDKVIFNTSPEDVLRVSINGHRFQIEHGDKIKTSSTGIAGPSTSFARAYLKKSSVGASTNAPFRTLIIGHFHNHYYANGVLVCNSVKGYDSYCAMLGIPFSLPGCSSFAVNNHGQLIYLTDIQIRNITTPKPRKSIELF